MSGKVLTSTVSDEIKFHLQSTLLSALKIKPKAMLYFIFPLCLSYFS